MDQVNLSMEEYEQFLRCLSILKDICNDADIREGFIRQRTNDSTTVFEINMSSVLDELNLPLLHQGQWCESYPFFVFCAHLSDKGNAMLFSEDWEFCEKAKQVGVKTYMDTRCIVGHMGDKVYTIEDVIHHNRQQEIRAKREGGILDVKEAEKALKATVEVLEAYTDRYWIDSGTLLSAFRDGDFNKYDHDIDVRVFKEDFPDEVMPSLIADLYDIGYMTLQQNTGERRQLLGLWKNEIMLDLKFCERNDDWLWYYVWDKQPGSSIDYESQAAVHLFPTKFYEDFGEIKIRGLKCKCPQSVEEYLTYHYGGQWRDFKVRAEDTHITDYKWDAQHSPPCAKSIREFEKLTGVASSAPNK